MLLNIWQMFSLSFPITSAEYHPLVYILANLIAREYISEQIREQIIFANFAETLKKSLNAKDVINLVK